VLAQGVLWQIKRCVKVPLHQWEYDAVTQLAYNIGEGAFCSSTLVRELNAGRYLEACQHISDFICGPATEATRAKPGAKCYYPDRPRKIIPGLVNRRERERELCMKGPA
jgi:GH24 family phage-related lysozyme (muramidase)